VKVSLALLLAGMCSLMPAGAHAQVRADDALSPARVDPAQLDRGYRRAHWRRNVGISLAAPGLALTILGAVLVGHGGWLQNERINLGSAGLEYYSGAVIGGMGLVLTIPGVVLWIMGQDDMDVVTWRKKQLLEIRF
jgi:hypothetical protein